MRKGFTLVELSIVLVIIGLLIGGILVGQSLIDSVKVSKEVSRITQWSIAVINFKQKFKQEPGDSNLFTPAGDNDSQTITSACPTAIDEWYLGWSHLSSAGMIKERYAWNSSDYCDAEFKNIGPFAQAGEDYAYIWAKARYPFFLQNPSGFAGYQRVMSVAFPSMTAFAIEKKIDDGSPTTGSIRSTTLDYSYNCDIDNLQLEADGHGGTPIKDVFCLQGIYYSPTSAPELPIVAN